MSFQAEAVVNLDTIAGNVANLARRTDAEIMVAVKADAYGHGLLDTSRACVAGGATRLGVATLPEAMALRADGVTVPVLAWLAAPGLALEPAIDADVSLGVSSLPQLREIVAVRASRPARVHLEADTGMGRGGVPEDEWGRLGEFAAKAQADGRIEVVGAWSHMACADEPQHPANRVQKAAYTRFLDALAAADLEPRLRHLANSAAMLTDRATHFDIVRPGIAVYGYSPIRGEGFGLRPAMTVRARLTLVKRLPAGHGVSYGHTFVTDRPTTVAIAPIGYADGIPRSTSNKAEVLVGGERHPIVGRVCMDQVVVGLGKAKAHPGDVVEFFGDGEITADDWADWHGTISYEILTSIGARVRRRYVGNP